MARLRGSVSALVGVAAVVALTSAVAVGSVAFLTHEGTAGVQSELGSRAGSDLALQVSLSPTANPDAQDAQVRAAIATSLGGTGIRFGVSRTVAGDVRVETDTAGAAVEQGTAMSIPDLETRADPVAGAFAEKETQVAVQADAARELGLAPGSTVSLDGATFTVTGTWRAKDYLDPRWYGDPMIETGADDGYGPFLIIERAWSRLESEPKATWTVVPVDLADATSTNIGGVIASWSRIQADWRGQVDDLQGFGFQRGLSKTLAELEVRLDGQRAIQPVILTLLGALGLVAALELVTLLAGIRATESYLHWSRGRAPWRIARRTATDVTVAATVGALVGCGAAAAVGLAVGFTDALVAQARTLAVVPLAALAACAVLAVITSLRSLRGMTRQTRGGRWDSRTTRRVAVPGAVVLVCAGAGIAVWQLRLYGSPVIVNAEGASSVDPLAVAAPAAALLALVLLIAALLPWLARRAERATARRSIPTTLAARSLALHAARFTAPLVVVAIAVGGTAVAAAYSATWTSSYDAASSLRVGSDLHASTTDHFSAASQRAVRDLVGEGAVAPWARQPLALGSVSGTIVGASPEAIATLASGGGMLDLPSAADSVRIPPPGPVVPEGASTLSLTLATTSLTVAPAVSAHVVDALGFTSVVDFAAPSGAVVDGKGTFGYSADLSATGPLTVLAIDFRFGSGTFAQSSATVRLVELAAGSQPLDLGPFWIPNNPGAGGEMPTSDGTGLGLAITDESASARLVPSLDGTEFERVHPPVVISQRLAALLGVGVGDTISFGLEDGVERISWDIAGVVPAIPGAPTEAAVLVDLAVVQHSQLRSTETPAEPRDLWLRADSPAELRDSLRPLLPASTRIDIANDPAAFAVLGSPRTVLWAAAAASLLLALIAVVSSVQARIRWGRGDVATLRALGLGPRDQQRVPVREFGAVLALGLLWGLAAGAAVALLTVPQIARAAVPERYLSIGTSVSWDVPGLAVLVSALVVGLLALLLALARATARLARAAVPGGGVE